MIQKTANVEFGAEQKHVDAVDLRKYQKILKNEDVIPKVGVDTAEDGHFKTWITYLTPIPLPQTTNVSTTFFQCSGQ